MSLWFFPLGEKFSTSVTDLVSSPESIQGQPVERCTSRATSDIGDNSHFEDSDFRQFDAVFFDLGRSVWWTEIPLLAQDLSQSAFRVRRPSKHKFLRSTGFFFLKYKRNASKLLWTI